VFVRAGITRRVLRLLHGLLAAAVLLLLPLLGLRGYWLDVITRVNIFLLLTLSLDLYSGTTFYLNLGIPFIAGSAAYTIALLNVYQKIPLELAIAPAVGVAVLLSFLIFLPSLRVRGIYFSILSLLLPIIATGIVTSQPFSLYLGGEGGLSYPALLYSYARSLPARERLPFLQLSYFYISAVVAIAAYVLTYKLAYSDLGFAMRAIGQDEVLAENAGIDTFKVKVVSFLASSTLAAVAGALYAAMRPPLTVDILIPANTLVPPLTAVVIGGMGSIVGPAVANYMLLIVYELLWDFVGRWRTVIFMALLIAMVISKPQGVIFSLYLRVKGYLATKLRSLKT